MHLVFGPSAKGTLKYFFNNNPSEYEGKIINICDDFSIGPVTHLEQVSGLMDRLEWLCDFFQQIMPEDCAEDFESECAECYSDLQRITPETTLIIWHGENASDQIGLRFLVSLLKEQNLYEIDMSSCSFVSLAQCSPEQITLLEEHIQPVRQPKIDHLCHEWSKLKLTKDTLRIFLNGHILNVHEDYYDSALLNNCTDEFQNAAKVVGKTMGQSSQLVSDSFLDYRLRILIKENTLKYAGKLEMLKDFDIKLSEV